MSMTLTLVPLAIAMGLSLTGTSVGILSSLNLGKKENETEEVDLEPVETIFTDREMLLKTLKEHGMQVEENGADLIVRTKSGVLRYFRESEGLPYFLQASGVKNAGELIDAIDSLENEYGRNVQAFTYHKVKESLQEHGMSIENEEILEDDSILLTLNI